MINKKISITKYFNSKIYEDFEKGEFMELDDFDLFVIKYHFENEINFEYQKLLEDYIMDSLKK